MEDVDAHVPVIIIEDEFCCGIDDTFTEELVGDA
jgi:hypothetical protein